MKWIPLAFILETCLLLFSASQLHSNMIFENLFTFWQRFWYKNDKCEGSWSYFSANIWHPVLLSLTRKTRLCENLPHLKIWAAINLPLFKNVIKCLWNQVVGEDQVKILPKSPTVERGHGTQVSLATIHSPSVIYHHLGGKKVSKSATNLWRLSFETRLQSVCEEREGGRQGTHTDLTPITCLPTPSFNCLHLAPPAYT